ncbi:hypothetical protein MCOR02_008203 [Pyricularia oryzae]|nr:hypothetical protein MCOR02_008203 [Pyricularia oryzae]
MQFSLAPPLSATESSNPPGGDTDFDLDSFITDATNNLLTDQFAGGNETGSAAGPPPTTGTTGDPMDTTGEGGDASNKVDVLADLLRLDGPTELSSADADAAGARALTTCGSRQEIPTWASLTVLTLRCELGLFAEIGGAPHCSLKRHFFLNKLDMDGLYPTLGQSENARYVEGICKRYPYVSFVY